jgi:hypothetical protein
VCRGSTGEEHPEGGLLGGVALISRPPGMPGPKNMRMPYYQNRTQKDGQMQAGRGLRPMAASGRQDQGSHGHRSIKKRRIL